VSAFVPTRRFGVVLLVLALLVPASAVDASASSRPLPTYFSTADGVEQLLTVTSQGWGSTRGTLTAWRKHEGAWQRVHGPVTVRLGWNGWAPAHRRRQNSGTTPAGQFTLRYAFGNRVNPGAKLGYRHVDRDDVWPYEPRDAATYNIYQPFQARTSHWRSDYRERLASYGYEYAYAVTLGYNLPSGVHWSERRHQYVAREPADTRRGGGIFLHVQKSRYTAGCVAGPIRDIRWVLRWLDPSRHPRIVMGPEAWLKRTF
jgi:L,D-peptidoglycan transpeptidase YkuD (ErfK/YbiS/YcfS/YnhG family)